MRISPKREISLLIILLLILTSLSAFSIIFSLFRIRLTIKTLKEEQLYLIEPLIERIVSGEEVKLPRVFDRIILDNYDTNPNFLGGVHIRNLVTLSDGRIVNVDAYYQDPISRVFTYTVLSLLLIIAAAITASSVLYFRLYRTMMIVVNKTKKETSILETVSNALDRIQAKEKEIELLASVVAHEVRNSLGSILATINDPQVKMEVDHINSFIKRLIEYTRLKEAKREIVSIPQLVEDAVADIDIPRGVKITKKIDEVDHSLDPLLFSSAIRNLIGNAIEACGGKGTIEITVQKPQSGILLKVTDNGTKIPDNIVKRIFEPFFSTKESGFGLGLAIVRRIIELHDGEINLKRSRTTKTFIITIP